MTHKARPTMYRGVRFRSKCEAVFARALDLSAIVWEYEPEWLRLEDLWTPDFFGVDVTNTNHGMISMVIEFKPGEVTETYRDELGNRFYELYSDARTPRSTLFGLAVANPFNPELESYLEFLEGNPGSLKWVRAKSLERIVRSINAAKDYRFDIEHGNNLVVM